VRNIFTIIIILIAWNCLNAQQAPQYTQYLFNYFAINPAVAGSKDCIDARLGYRTQWVGFEGAPQTSFANAHGQIKSKKRHRKEKHGVGLMVESDQTGPTARTYFNLAYAYHIPVSRDYMLSGGLYAGLMQYRVDAGAMTLSTFNDPAIQASSGAFLYPDITPGLFLYSDKQYVGLSVRHIVMNRIRNLGLESNLVHHYSLVAGRKIELDNYYTLIPSFNLRFAPVVPLGLDLNLMVDIRNSVMLGLSYRNIDALAALVQFKVFKYITLGYAFDFTTSRIRHGSSNTHEIIIGIYSCPSKGGSGGYICPAYQ
jgi:type IX secretion system PorP/SprF family membrane protein